MLGRLFSIRKREGAQKTALSQRTKRVWLVRFLQKEEGATAIEYAVMLSLIIAACATGITMVGQKTQESLDNTVNKIDDAFH